MFQTSATNSQFWEVAKSSTEGTVMNCLTGESIKKAELASYDEEVSGSQLNILILSPAMNSVLHGCFEVHIFQSLCSDLGQSCV